MAIKLVRFKRGVSVPEILNIEQVDIFNIKKFIENEYLMDTSNKLALVKDSDEGYINLIYNTPIVKLS